MLHEHHPQQMMVTVAEESMKPLWQSSPFTRHDTILVSKIQEAEVKNMKSAEACTVRSVRLANDVYEKLKESSQVNLRSVNAEIEAILRKHYKIPPCKYNTKTSGD